MFVSINVWEYEYMKENMCVHECVCIVVMIIRYDLSHFHQMRNWASLNYDRNYSNMWSAVPATVKNAGYSWEFPNEQAYSARGLWAQWAG